MTRRGWWISGVGVTAAALLCGGLWAYQSRAPEGAAACTSCDARHQNLADRRGNMAKTTSGSLTPPTEDGVSD